MGQEKRINEPRQRFPERVKPTHFTAAIPMTWIDRFSAPKPSRTRQGRVLSVTSGRSYDRQPDGSVAALPECRAGHVRRKPREARKTSRDIDAR